MTFYPIFPPIIPAQISNQRRVRASRVERNGANAFFDEPFHGSLWEKGSFDHGVSPARWFKDGKSSFAHRSVFPLPIFFCSWQVFIPGEVDQASKHHFASPAVYSERLCASFGCNSPCSISHSPSSFMRMHWVLGVIRELVYRLTIS